MREPLIRVGHRARSRKIIRPQLDNLKTCARNEIVDFAIEVATSTDLLPHWSYTILPDNYARIARAAMFLKCRCDGSVRHKAKNLGGTLRRISSLARGRALCRLLQQLSRLAEYQPGTVVSAFAMGS